MSEEKKWTEEEIKAKTAKCLKSFFDSGQTYFMFYALKQNPKYSKYGMCSVCQAKIGDKIVYPVRTLSMTSGGAVSSMPVEGAVVEIYSTLEEMVEDGWRSLHEDTILKY